jgi:hypothetical protein
MAALTAMTARQTRNDSLASYATYTCTTGTTIYEGSLVMVTLATGLALPGADTASCGFVGIATNTVVSAAAGQTINVKFGHEELLGAASSLAAVTGAACVISDSDLVTTAAAATNDVKVGEVVQPVSTTAAWVKIRSSATV